MIVNQLIDTTKTSIFLKKVSLIKVGMKLYNTLVPDINYSVVNPPSSLGNWQPIGGMREPPDPDTSPSSIFILNLLCDLGRLLPLSVFISYNIGIELGDFQSCFQLQLLHFMIQRMV